MITTITRNLKLLPQSMDSTNSEGDLSRHALISCAGPSINPLNDILEVVATDACSLQQFLNFN